MSDIPDELFDVGKGVVGFPLWIFRDKAIRIVDVGLDESEYAMNERSAVAQFVVSPWCIAFEDVVVCVFEDGNVEVGSLTPDEYFSCW